MLFLKVERAFLENGSRKQRSHIQGNGLYKQQILPNIMKILANEIEATSNLYGYIEVINIFGTA